MTEFQRPILDLSWSTDGNRATNDVRNAVAPNPPEIYPRHQLEPIVQRLGSLMSDMTYAAGTGAHSRSGNAWLTRQLAAAFFVCECAQIQRIGGVDHEIRVDLTINSAAKLLRITILR